MIPEAKTILQKVANTHFSVITARGRKKPYTLDNLFDIQNQYKVEGLGSSFLEYFKLLQAEGKEIGIKEIVLYFKGHIIFHTFTSALSNFASLFLPLLLEIYLSWLGKEDDDPSRGFWLLVWILVVSGAHLVGEYQVNCVSEQNKIRYVSALGVS